MLSVELNQTVVRHGILDDLAGPTLRRARCKVPTILCPKTGHAGLLGKESLMRDRS